MSKFLKTLNLDEATRYDVVSSTISYLGKAFIGTNTTENKWKIARLTSDTSGGIYTEFADAGNYTQIWDNRTSLSYS